MKYTIVRGAILSLILTLLMGCAVNRNVALQENFWQNKKQKITVASIKSPTPQVHQMGSQGLLDIAITGIANKKLSDSVKKHDLAWYHEMPNSFAKRLKEQGMKATVYSRNIEKNQNKYSQILAETHDDLLLTLELKSVGARREYVGGFMPQGGPEGYCVMVGTLMDPNDKKVLWHYESEVIQKVVGEWDQPPNFPNFHSALNLAVAEAKQEVLDSLFSGH